MIPQCATCARLKGIRACEAYPLGIPDEIFENVLDHSVPLPNDRGLQYVRRGS